MATINAGEIWQLVAVCQCGDQIGLNVTHWVAGAVVGPATTGASWAAVKGAELGPLYRGCMGPNAAYQGCKVQRRFPLPPTAPETSAVGVGAGTAVGDTLPRQVAGLLRLRTNFAGRSYRGRLYVPFPTEEHTDAFGRPTVGYNGLLNALAGAYMGADVIIGGGGASVTMTPVIWNKNSPAEAPTIVTALSSGRFATQRRRGEYGAPNISPI